MAICNKKISILIEAPSEDLNFLVWVDDEDLRLNKESNKFPSPRSRQITNASIYNDEDYNISGWVHCLRCGFLFGNEIDVTDVVPKLKREMIRQTYTTDELITITTDYYMLNNMFLRDVSANRRGKTPQELNITMTFSSSNLSGSIQNPLSNNGGVIV